MVVTNNQIQSNNFALFRHFSTGVTKMPNFPGAQFRSGWVRLSKARLGEARQGWVRLGKVRRGKARLGEARQGKASLG
jgi:hypothetical protein